ncbi:MULTISPECIES: ATP synthase F1 subunit delta [unclassified Adlercreutzia]|uniref:ATP synthase F1 subunit delta n=1 Tax=unclassified Adlercreutzia TaxID=2636013 RepID=UPI0013EA7BEE|nr:MULTISPECIES: ATP synthase F1 subunit delta [unclassified Adlercreutzia]
MATNRLVQREKIAVYAEAMFNAANASGGKDAVLEVRNQMDQVKTLMYSDMDLSLALANPDYTPEQRRQLAEAAFADCNIAFSKVASIMAENGDAEELPRVFRMYAELMKQELNLCVVDVVTAVSLDDDLRKLIKDKVQADLGLEAMLNESVDKSILGGIVMSVNGMRIDASMISQLNRARHTLKETDGGES